MANEARGATRPTDLLERKSFPSNAIHFPGVGPEFVVGLFAGVGQCAQSRADHRCLPRYSCLPCSLPPLPLRRATPLRSPGLLHSSQTASTSQPGTSFAVPSPEGLTRKFPAYPQTPPPTQTAKFP